VIFITESIHVLVALPGLRSSLRFLNFLHVCVVLNSRFYFSVNRSITFNYPCLLLSLVFVSRILHFACMLRLFAWHLRTSPYIQTSILQTGHRSPAGYGRRITSRQEETTRLNKLIKWSPTDLRREYCRNGRHIVTGRSRGSILCSRDFDTVPRTDRKIVKMMRERGRKRT